MTLKAAAMTLWCMRCMIGQYHRAIESRCCAAHPFTTDQRWYRGGHGSFASLGMATTRRKKGATPNVQSHSDVQAANEAQSSAAGAERRLRELGIELTAPPEPFGAYVEAVSVGNLLFLSGMLPTKGREAQFVGRVGAELDVETGRKAARLAALNALAVARQHLGSLDRVIRVVRLGVFIATAGDVREHPKVADGASELLQGVFGESRNPCRSVLGVASLPLGTAVELELLFQVETSAVDAGFTAA